MAEPGPIKVKFEIDKDSLDELVEHVRARLRPLLDEAVKESLDALTAERRYRR